MKKEEGEKDIVGDSKNDVRDNVILEPLHSQELLSSAVPEQASSVPRGAASVQASYEPRGACRGPHTDFGRLTKNEGEITSYKWIMPKTMLMEKNNRTWIRELESYEKNSIKEEGEGKLKIQKVPAILRGVKSNEECYNPMIVAIGPYHQGKGKLPETCLEMQKFKIQFTLEYADQSGKSIRELYENMENCLVEAKNCYIEDLVKEFDNKEFAKMLFLDNCFVIQFMYSCVHPKKSGIKTTNINTAFIKRDIMLLENQLPFNILTELMSFSERFNERDEGKKMIGKFIDLIMNDCHQPNSKSKGTNKEEEHVQPNSKSKGTNKKDKEDVQHLLELVQTKFVDDTDIEKILSKEDAPRRKTYFWFCQSNSNKEIKNEASDKSSLNWGLYRSVKELKLVGIHFKPSETCRFSDIKFNSGHLCGWLKLPRIIIKDGTKSLLLNLVAFEACADTSRNFGVSSYVYFMDTLIDHAEDAKELRSKGIIHNLLGSDEEVAKLFNEISENVVPDFGVVRNVEESLNAFFKSRRRLWLTECWHNHLRSPWAIIALLAAIVVVCLTITQTIFSAIQL
ncbi:uncharacterized protein LOC127790876 isoform X2 [Diospyros lotus]|uniref:uncharacterized protein LOC127790876 isoform X2 n=1 Tax=Diospyros lotus TaxID=55363 RepID=UPI002250E8EA|nr:uncharacterized protein LOC127790876 isoform X2 [Diospyros lotus]